MDGEEHGDSFARCDYGHYTFYLRLCTDTSPWPPWTLKKFRGLPITGQ